MRPTRKSSTLIKKEQSLLKPKQGFNNELKKIERIQNNFISANQQTNNNVTMKNSSLMSNKTNMGRTFLRQNKASSLIERKMPVRNITKNNIQNHNITKTKVFSAINPEQKKITSSNEAHLQMLNTRKSKFQTDSNIKNLKKDQQKQKSTNLRSRIISINPVKNSGNKNNIKKQQQKKQAKNESQSIVQQCKKQQQKIEEKKQINSQQVEKKQGTLNQTIQMNRNQRQVYYNSVQNYTGDLVQQRQLSIQPNQPENRIQEPIIGQQNYNISQSSNIQSSQRQIPVRQEPNSSQNLQNQRNIDLAALISNTQDIINFINRLNLNNRIPAFDLMVGQLVQLNLIAQQVHQLGQIGNNLGYSLVNVFGTRIRELQTTIINQVGIALINSFSERVDPQFQALVLRQPSLRTGFSKADIEKTFDEKLSFEEVQCSICLDNVKQGEKLIELQCHHEFHPICIKTWLENSKKCPMCRAEQQRKTT